MSGTETPSDERGAPDQPVILVVDDDERGVRHGSMKRVGAAVGEGAGAIQDACRRIHGFP